MNKSTEYTKTKVKLRDIADIFSGVYAKGTPTGEVACLQVKDLFMPSPETTATRIELTPKLYNYILKKGDLLFAGKGATYLCEIFNFDIIILLFCMCFAKKADAFSSEELISYLNSKHISEIEMIGVDGNSCIKASAKGAVKCGFIVSIILSCVICILVIANVR